MLISAIFSFHTTVKNNLLSHNFPYYQSATMTDAASWNIFFLVSWSSCSSNPASSCRLLDLLISFFKGNWERKPDKFHQSQAQDSILVEVEVIQNIRQGLEGTGFTKWAWAKSPGLLWWRTVSLTNQEVNICLFKISNTSKIWSKLLLLFHPFDLFLEGNTVFHVQHFN